MQRRTSRRPAARALAGVLLALAIPGIGAAVAVRATDATTRPTAIAATARSGSAATETTISPAPSRAIPGTKVAVPIPPAALGTVVRDLEIPLEGAEGADGAVVHGVAFYRPGPVSGSVVGGTTVVYDDVSPVIRKAAGAVPDVGDVAKAVRPDRSPTVQVLAGHAVLGWPRSETVPADEIPQQPRSVSRYVLLLPGAQVMVTFDGVSDEAAAMYLETLAGAL